MKLAPFLPLFALGLVTMAACSSASGTEGRASADAVKERANEDTFDAKKAETDIVFGEDARFTKRDCALTVRWTGGGSDVRIAGEFSQWAGLPMTPTADGAHEITLSPNMGIEGGKLFAYKVIADGTWKIDPAAKYRKILGGQMNSGLVLPACNASPEALSGKVAVQADTMKVRVTVRAAADGASAERVKASFDNDALAAGTYMVDAASGAIDFSFAGLAKGKHKLSIRAFYARGREAEPIDLPFWVEDEAFDYRDGILYMMMLDRFANGDTTNDAPLGAPVHYDADWHGGDLQGALAVMKNGYFEKMGVRTIWLSPLNFQTSKSEIGDGNQLYSAYHGYWPTKSRAVEPRFGGAGALRAFVQEAHKRGLRVLLDLINNQVHEDHEYISENASWFRRACKCGDDAVGCGWSVRPFDCMFQPYLPDIDWNQAGAEKRFISDAVSWLSEFDLDGFRVDAVKHVESNSIYNMRAELSRRFEQGGSRIFMVGETAVGAFDSGEFFGEKFKDGYDWIDAYTGPNALDGQFDFPTRHSMADGLVNGDQPLNEVEAQIKKAETRYRPGSHHVRFLNGHDNPRIASIAAKDPKLGCTWTSGCRDEQLPPLAYDDAQVYVKLKRALAVLYTMPGVPYLYMGDEVAFGGGGDPDMRRNMLFGEGLEPTEMTKPGERPKRLVPAQAGIRDWVRKLGALRTGSHAIRRGERITLLGGDANLWVYAYQTGPQDLAVIAINRGAAVTRTIPAGQLALGAVSELQSPLGAGSASASNGSLTITLGAGEGAIFVAR